MVQDDATHERKPLSRREVLKLGGVSGIGLFLAGCVPEFLNTPKDEYRRLETGDTVQMMVENVAQWVRFELPALSHDTFQEPIIRIEKTEGVAGRMFVPKTESFHPGDSRERWTGEVTDGNLVPLMINPVLRKNDVDKVGVYRIPTSLKDNQADKLREGDPEHYGWHGIKVITVPENWMGKEFGDPPMEMNSDYREGRDTLPAFGEGWLVGEMTQTESGNSVFTARGYVVDGRALAPIS